MRVLAFSVRRIHANAKRKQAICSGNQRKEVATHQWIIKSSPAVMVLWCPEKARLSSFSM